jgi:hypothetical protein
MLMEGVTTAIVAFIFVCVIYPHLVKNRAQYYGALAAIILVILFSNFGQMSDSDKFRHFVAGFDALLQVAAILLLVVSTGGVTVRELATDIGKTIEVVRRGGEKETIIVPLRGDQPKPRGQSSIPME